MKITLFCCVVLMTGTTAFAQSKKELQAEVNKLKAEIEELKKPKEVILDDTTKKASYALGTLVAMNLRSQGGDSLNVEAVTQGLKDVFENKDLKIKQEEAMMLAQNFMMQGMERKSAAARQEGESFLNENKTKEGVQVTESGLQYKVITPGTGKSPAPTDQVTVHYTGKLVDGTVFDSSVERGEPATFGVNQVIPGWTEALQMMKEGGKWILYIPSDLGYGERGAGSQIPPHSPLIFEVELIKVN